MTYIGGGFANSRDERLPESLAIRAEVADELDRRQVAQEEQRRAERARLFEMRAIQASAVLAEDRGELVDRRRALTHGVGHTPAEFLQIIAAQQDAEDVRGEWAERREFELWKRKRQEATQADTSAPTEAEVAEQQQEAARTAEVNARRHERVITVRQARAMASWDRERERS